MKPTNKKPHDIFEELGKIFTPVNLEEVVNKFNNGDLQNDADKHLLADEMIIEKFEDDIDGETQYNLRVNDDGYFYYSEADRDFDFARAKGLFTKWLTPPVKEELTYKVVNNLHEMDFYTDSKEEAEKVFKEYVAEYGDGIRLYEALKPDNEDDAPEWETIDCFDADEEDMQEYTPERNYTKGKWMFDGVECIVSDTGKIIADIRPCNHDGEELEGLIFNENKEQAEANASRIVECVNGWDALNYKLTGKEKAIEILFKENDRVRKEIEELKKGLNNIILESSEWDSPSHNRITEMATELLNRLK
jgi:hypothetical protein